MQRSALRRVEVGGHAGIVAGGGYAVAWGLRGEKRLVRLLKWLAGSLVALVLLAVAVYLVSRAMGPTPAEREALALVDAPLQLPPGSDGFAALYSVRHDVPRADQARVLAEDVRRFSATAPLALQETSGTPAWHSVLEDWPVLAESRPDDPRWCPLREAGCIDRVRAARDAYAGLVERHAVSLDRAEALGGYDYFHNPFPARLDMPMPAYQPLTQLPTRHAWRFASGQVDDLHDWRRKSRRLRMQLSALRKLQVAPRGKAARLPPRFISQLVDQLGALQDLVLLHRTLEALEPAHARAKRIVPRSRVRTASPIQPLA